jgi:hypothetical protein
MNKKNAFIVPPLFRDKTKVIKLTTINPKQVEDPVHSFQI